MLKPYQVNFIEAAQQVSALRFGEFTLKSGRLSPYFFNAGCFNDGQSLTALATCYAEKIIAEEIEFDVLFGPAYKGIPLVASIAVILHQKTGRNIPWAFNRKEVKKHGEGGNVVGSALRGRVLLVDDVITAGTAIRDSIALIHSHPAEITDILVALDRQEVMTEPNDSEERLSAIQKLQAEHGINTHSIISFDHLIDFAREHDSVKPHLAAMTDYRKRYGSA